jgi:hypothetical protein
MNRHLSPVPVDEALCALLDERDHTNIQISLLKDADSPDLYRMEQLHRKMVVLQERIRTHSPTEA